MCVCVCGCVFKAPGKYVVAADYEKGGPQDLSVKNGDMVQLVKEGEDGQW